MKLKICKGDTVEIVAGDDKGHRGEVQRIIRKKSKDGSYDANRVFVIVSGANLIVKHQRATGRVNTQTGRIKREAPIHISNVMMVGSENRPTRTGYEVTDGGEKTRIDRRSGSPLPKPSV